MQNLNVTWLLIWVSSYEYTINQSNISHFKNGNHIFQYGRHKANFICSLYSKQIDCMKMVSTVNTIYQCIFQITEEYKRRNICLGLVTVHVQYMTDWCSSPLDHKRLYFWNDQIQWHELWVILNKQILVLEVKITTKNVTAIRSQSNYTYEVFSDLTVTVTLQMWPVKLKLRKHGLIIDPNCSTVLSGLSRVFKWTGGQDPVHGRTDRWQSHPYIGRGYNFVLSETVPPTELTW